MDIWRLESKPDMTWPVRLLLRGAVPSRMAIIIAFYFGVPEFFKAVARYWVFIRKYVLFLLNRSPMERYDRMLHIHSTYEVRNRQNRIPISKSDGDEERRVGDEERRDGGGAPLAMA